MAKLSSSFFALTELPFSWLDWQNLIAKFLCRDRNFLFRDWTVVKIKRSKILTVQSRKRKFCQGKEWVREFCYFRATLFQLLGCIFYTAQASWPHKAIKIDFGILIKHCGQKWWVNLLKYTLGSGQKVSRSFFENSRP